MTIQTNTVNFSKTGITVGYTDNSGAAVNQNISFQNKTFSIDSGFNVTAGDSALAGALAVTGVANLNNAVNVTGAAACNSTLDVIGASHLHNTMLVDGAASLGSTLYVAGVANMNAALNVAGDAAVVGALNLTGVANLNNAVHVVGAADLASSLAVAGAANLASSLAVAGAANLGNTLDVTGASHLHNTLLVDGAASLGSTLTVTGAAVINNNVTVNGTSSLNGALTVSGASSLGGALTVTGGSTLNSTLDVTGASHLHNALVVDGAASLGTSLDVAGASNFADVLNVVGPSHMSNTLLVDGAASLGSSLAVTGAANLSNVLNVTGASHMSNTLLVDGAANLGNTLAVTGAANLGNTLAVTGASSLRSTLAVSGAASFNNNVTVVGNLTVLGSQTSINTNNLEVKDNAIVIADNNTSDSLQSGVQMQYQSTGSSVPMYAGLKRIPVSGNTGGNFVLFKDATTKIAETSQDNAAPTPVSGEWFQIVLGNPSQISSYGLMLYDNLEYQQLTAWDVVGSNDESTWTLIDSRDVSVNTFNSYNVIPFTLPTVSSAYRYVRFILKKYACSDPYFLIRYGMVMYDASNQLIQSQSGSMSSAFGAPIMSQLNHRADDITSVEGPTVQAWTVQGGGNTQQSTFMAVYSGANNAYTGATVTNVIIPPPAAPADIYAGLIADSFSCASDMNLKKNIVALDGALDKIDGMRGVYHDWIDENQSQDRQIGVIAQEVQAVYPELVATGANGYLSVNYPKLTAVLLQSVKELKAMVLAMKQ
jgi:acyl-[acyl carrier protein]--UDP-N-acetylglucosamine O-acyltransferase